MNFCVAAIVHCTSVDEKIMPDPKPADKPAPHYERPSERMFRRSRARTAKRRLAERKEDRFIRLIAGVAGFTILIAFLFFYVLTSPANALEGNQIDGLENNTSLTVPLLGNFTLLDLMGIAFVVVAGYAVWRKYNSKD